MCYVVGVALRFDASRISKGRKTPQGFVRVDARPTRTGVLVYRRADGSVQRELRLPEEVFKQDSLETLRGAPVTELHPTEMVSPVNVGRLRKGGADHPRKDGHLVAAELQIEDADVIAKVDRGELQEISCGYHCKLDHTPGVWQGQAYDAVQREIVYNHVALGPRGWGRAGAEVSLRLDSLDSDWAANFDSAEDTPHNVGESRHENREENFMALKIDGVEIKLDGTEAQLVEQALSKRDAQIAQLTADAAAAQTASAKQVAELTAARDVLQGKLDAAASPDTIAKAVAARVALETAARKVLGAEAKFDGQTDAQVRAAALAKAAPQIKLDGQSDAYIVAAFDLATAGAVKTSLDDVNGASGARKDSVDPIEAARAKSIEAKRAACK